MKDNLIVSYDDLVSLYGKSRVNREIDIEMESKELAKNKFLNELYKKTESGQRATTGTAKKFLEEALPLYIKGLNDFLEEANSGKSGRKHTLVKPLMEASPEAIAYIAVKTILSFTAIKPLAPLSSLCRDIGKEVEREVRFSRVFKVQDAKDNKKTTVGLSKRIGMSYKEAYMKATEAFLVESGKLEKWDKWSTRELVTVGIKLTEIFCCTTGLGKLQKVHDKEKFSYNFVLYQGISDYITHNDLDLADLMFKCRPMVIPPKKWSTPFNGGYYLKLRRPEHLVKQPSKIVHELYDEVDMPNVYKAVNAIQETPWRINKRVLNVAKEVLDWKNIPIGLGIPSKEPPEPPLRPAEADTNPEVQRAWRHSMVIYYQNLASSRGKRLLTDSLAALATYYESDPEIYFPHNVDFRGRVYPMTTLSPQGNDFSKGLLEFAEGVPLGETGARWLAFHGANLYGLDKKPLQDRLEWVYSNPELFISIAKDPLEDLRWTEADSPWEFLGFCFEWDQYLKEGDSFKSHIPVAFDGSCSGIQHFSAMLRDEIGGVAVNLVPDSQVHDIYKIVADKVTEYLKEDLINGTEDEFKTAEDGNTYLNKGTLSLAKEWLTFGVTRKVTKRSVMTLPYGSKQYGFGEQILEDTIYPAIQKNPLLFSKPNQAARYLAGLIWRAVSEVVVKAVEAMGWLQNASTLLASDRDILGNQIPVTWVTPAGFPVRQKYEKLVKSQIQTVLSGSLTIFDPLDKSEKVLNKGDVIRPMVWVPKEGDLDPRRQRQGIAPNFVHSMDASHLMLTVCACYDKGIKSYSMIHDSYGTHAGNADILFRTVREVFVKTYTENDVLQDLHDHIANLLSPKKLKNLEDIPQKGTLDLNCVLDSVYAFS